WYRNTPDGLEQGFELAEPSRGDGSLVLELDVADARARSRGSAIELRSESGRTLSYGQVSARDADGRELVARLEAPEPSRVRIVVDDRGGQYPLTIDPLLKAIADAVIESNQVNGQLGLSVASAGDVNGDGYADVIVGAPVYDNGETDEGAAFVFLGGPSGI